ncbi:MAG: phosphatidyl-myo-inositol alpha-mannosyltransferase [Actinomycetota bacterium]|jgi:phosphatidylinositol alpha-mannosyltransferase|nr:phosphatidyl-myo-inositol alpha-mannosyltransferase [Actinomycetota bacterium]
MGIEARVLAPCDGPPPATFVTPLGDSIPTASNGSMAPVAPDPSATLRTIRVLRDEQFDVLHIHEPIAPGASMTSLLMHTAPVVGTFHAAGRSLAYRWLMPVTAWMAMRIDLRVAVSDMAADFARSHLGGEYEVLFNGIEIDRYRGVEPVKPDGPTIFFCGRHEPRKGLEVLLESLASLPRPVRLWVASDGPDTDRLRSRFAGDPRVTWLGRVSDEEKIARMRGASVFCAPSVGGESFGVVLLEAMAAGTPVVASDLPGYRAVAGSSAARLVPPGDRLALSAALADVLTDDDVADELRRAGEARAQLFSMDRLAALYVERYERVRAGTELVPRKVWRRWLP